MTDLDKLLLSREHFPIVLCEVTGDRGNKFWDFNRIEIPPYHPSMVENGINFKSVPELLYEIVEATVKDLEEITEKKKNIQLVLQDVSIDKISGRILFEPQFVEQNDSGIEIDSVPIVGHLWVGEYEINPYRYGGDQGISIYPEHRASSFSVPENVKFSPELMKEYEMTDRGVFFGMRRIECPNGWHGHNLNVFNAIFYKNLVIALDNAVIRKR